MDAKLKIYQVDAFTDRVFNGNPAAIVPLETWLPDSVMMQIAMENNLSETAFFVPHSSEAYDFEIRWFTPTTEVELCGHATMGSCLVIWDYLGFEPSVIRLKTREAGDLTVSRDLDSGKIQLDLPYRPAKEVELPEGFVERLNVKPVYFGRALKNIAVLEDAAAVNSFIPDYDYIASLTEGDGLIITAPANLGDTTESKLDCVSRYFAPASGIDEDPVTGSAHCTIVPYWATRLGKTRILARQVSARGGNLDCEVSGDRVVISGDARLYLKGEIFIQY
ncbi:MAG: PhzF family phenazine biosynthesis protein [Alphaproteobacteria bacterium]|nr:PhzF family phenazine biosynthesis protein [Alphaproteobacteria bacterium]